MYKSVVFYHFFDLNDKYLENLIYFISTGWNNQSDFYIVDASNKNSPILPPLENLKLIKTKNLNLDYGGYCQAIEALGKKIDKYDELIFINSSVRGPFLKEKTLHWQSQFTSKINNETCLVGSSINILNPSSKDSIDYQNNYGSTPPFTHVQTTAYAISQNFFSELLRSNFYDNKTFSKKSELIQFYEIGLSQRAFILGYNIDCLVPKYSGIDYRKIKNDFNPTSRDGDILRRKAYFGETIKPFDLLFIKTNRRLLNDYKLAWITYKNLSSVENPIIKEWLFYKKLVKKLKLKIISPICLGVFLLIIFAIYYSDKNF